MPLGRISSTAIRIMKATAARHSRAHDLDGQGFPSPTINPPMNAPGTLPMPPRIAAANNGQQKIETHQRPDLHEQAHHHAGRAGERPADQPGRPDRRVDIDAR